MARANQATMREGVRYIKDHPDLTTAELVEITGLSDSSIGRARAGGYDHLLEDTTPISESGEEEKQATAHSAAPSSPPPPSPSQRKAKKTKRRLSEPNERAVEGLYTLACSITGVALYFTPRYQMTEREQESIIRPVCRMWLRRHSVPDVTSNPDARDMILLATGVMMYGSRVAFGHRAPDLPAGGIGDTWGDISGPDYHGPRNTGPTFARGAGSDHAPRHSGDGAGGGTEYLGANPGDPQTIMDNLAQRLAEAESRNNADAEAVDAAIGSDA